MTPAAGPSSDPFDALIRAALEVPLELSGEALDRLRAYVDTLLLWRQRLSLTTATTARSILLDHILDSFYIAPLIKPAFRVADIGSGAGFPGVPLAIVCSTAHFVLVESRRKRANFLREVVRAARLGNVEVTEERAESLASDYPEPFDAVVSRALGSVSTLLALATPLLRPGGLAIAMKGPKGRKETTEHTRFNPAPAIEYHLPSGAQHLLVVFSRAKS